MRENKIKHLTIRMAESDITKAQELADEVMDGNLSETLRYLIRSADIYQIRVELETERQRLREEAEAAAAAAAQEAAREGRGLNEAAIAWVRELYQSGMKQQTIADLFEVSQTYISKIIRQGEAQTEAETEAATGD